MPHGETPLPRWYHTPTNSFYTAGGISLPISKRPCPTSHYWDKTVRTVLLSSSDGGGFMSGMPLPTRYYSQYSPVAGHLEAWVYWLDRRVSLGTKDCCPIVPAAQVSPSILSFTSHTISYLFMVHCPVKVDQR